MGLPAGGGRWDLEVLALLLEGMMDLLLLLLLLCCCRGWGEFEVEVEGGTGELVTLPRPPPPLPPLTAVAAVNEATPIPAPTVLPLAEVVGAGLVVGEVLSTSRLLASGVSSVIKSI